MQCSTCELNDMRAFCNLSSEALRSFEAIAHTSFYLQGSTLFLEAEPPHGVFILCDSSVKISISSRNGRSLMRIAERGAILGLSATVTGLPYEVSAAVHESGLIRFIGRKDFLNFLRKYSEAGLRATQQISYEYLAINDQVRALALSDTVAEKLAKLLLSWRPKDRNPNEQSFHIKMSLTHGELAQMIGVSRETVTRILSEFKTRRLIELKGADLYIPNRANLESIAGI